MSQDRVKTLEKYFFDEKSISVLSKFLSFQDWFLKQEKRLKSIADKCKGIYNPVSQKLR